MQRVEPLLVLMGCSIMVDHWPPSSGQIAKVKDIRVTARNVMAYVESVMHLLA
jgi:hypothetical protein